MLSHSTLPSYLQLMYYCFFCEIIAFWYFFFFASKIWLTVQTLVTGFLNESIVHIFLIDTKTSPPKALLSEVCRLGSQGRKEFLERDCFPLLPSAIQLCYIPMCVLAPDSYQPRILPIRGARFGRWSRDCAWAKYSATQDAASETAVGSTQPVLVCSWRQNRDQAFCQGHWNLQAFSACG